MRKLFFLLIAAAASLSFVSCNDSAAPAAGNGDSGTVRETPSSGNPASSPAGSDTSQQSWAGWVNVMPGSGSPKLIVTGEILVGPQRPNWQLVKAEPQGINPSILILELAPAPTPGENRIQLRYEEEVKRGQYTAVEIRMEGRESVMIQPLEEVQ